MNEGRVTAAIFLELRRLLILLTVTSLFQNFIDMVLEEAP